MADLGLRAQLTWINENVGGALDENERTTFLSLLAKLLDRSSPGSEPPPGD